MSDVHSAADAYKLITSKFDDLSKAYISPYTKYGPTQQTNLSVTPTQQKTNISDPAFDRGWNVIHEAPHGTYRTTGPMSANTPVGSSPASRSIELMYAPRRTGKFQSLGFFGNKEEAEQARLGHHDMAAAGLLKSDGVAPQLHSTVEGFMTGLKATPKGSPARGQFITSHMNHAPFLNALAAHPQGAQVKQMLNSHLNSTANAGFRQGATQTVVKSNFEMKESEEMNKNEHSVAEAFEALRKSLVEKIKSGMTELQKAENAGNENLGKGIGSLPSSTPSSKELHSDYLNKKAVLLHVGKEVSAEGSGGQVTKGQKLGKAALPMQMPKPPSLKPAGVPGAKAGQAPKAPTTPKAPGATNPVAKAQPQSEGAVGAHPLAMNELQKAFDDWKVRKMELPHSSTKASGGQMAKMDLPTSATIPTGIKVTGNPEGVQHGEAGSSGSSGDHQYQPGAMGSAPSPKSPAGLPTTSEAALGGNVKGATVPAGPEVNGRPGATQTPEMGKMELPHTNQNANRGKVVGASVPAGPAVKGNAEGIQKAESKKHKFVTKPFTEDYGERRNTCLTCGKEKGHSIHVTESETKKMELPQTATKADGGQKSSAKVPAGPQVKGRPGAVQKEEMSPEGSSSEETPLTEESSATEVHSKMNKGHSVDGSTLNKGYPNPLVPGPGISPAQRGRRTGYHPPVHSQGEPARINVFGRNRTNQSALFDRLSAKHPEFASGKLDQELSEKLNPNNPQAQAVGPFVKNTLNKTAMHPSPVFNVLSQGGARGMKHAMMNDPKAGPTSAPTTPSPAKPMPTPAMHAQRAASFSDFMPQGKFGKSELDSMERLVKARVIARQASN